MSSGVVRGSRVVRVLFWAYVAITFLHIAYVVHHEPFAFDAWNVAVDTHAEPPSIGRFFAFWHQQYTESNPRFGQPLAYLAYKVVGVAELGTPLAFCAIVVAGFVLGCARWPSRRDHRDLATLAIGLGAMWFAAPNLPAYAFCRAYATNYLWACAIQLWFLVPLRLAGAAEASPPAWQLALYGLLGMAAGASNEHTGPTLVAATAGFAWWVHRRHRRWSPLALVGGAGALAGFAIIFFAPGQAQRYGGLAEHYSAAQQVLVRGISGNVEIFLALLDALAPLLVLAMFAIAIGLHTDRRSGHELAGSREAQRRALAFVAIAIVCASAITITVFASPKLGPRFFLHACMLVLAAVLGVVRTFLDRPRAFAPFLVVAMIASGYAIARTVPTYTRLAHDSERRLAELAATPPHGVYTAEAWEPVTESWWALGDDARDQQKRDLLAHYFALDRVLFRGADLWKPLGVTDVKLTLHYTLEQPMCLDEVDELDLQPWLGKDVGALHHSMLDAIAEIERVTGSHVKTAELHATFLGAKPPLPRAHLLVARYAGGKLEGYTAKLARAGRSKRRDLALSPALRAQDFEIYVIAIGDPPKRLGSSTSPEPLGYEPWRSGTYWALACKTDACFVLLSTSHVAF